MLELNGVCAGYGGKSVLSDITTSFEKGQLVGIIGVNGCGKSTLLKTIIGILPTYGGSITIDGMDKSLLHRNEIAKKISYLAQWKSTPDMTVEQMVLHGRFPYLSIRRRYNEKDREIAREAMKSVDILQYADSPLYTLSGGMRQSAYIAMALAQGTDYILLDEPTTYLDIAHQLELMNMLKGLRDAGKGIITVLHDIPMAFNFSDKLLVVDKGCIRSQGDPEKIAEESVLEDVFRVSLKRSEGKGGYYYDI